MSKCEVCGEPMPEGEEMFKFHGYSGPCPAPPLAKVDSASNDRTANNAVRHQYRVLSDEEKALMVEIKDMGAAFIAKLHEIGGTDPTGGHLASRDLSLAQTHAEDAVMRAVRHITA